MIILWDGSRDPAVHDCRRRSLERDRDASKSRRGKSSLRQLRDLEFCGDGTQALVKYLSLIELRIVICAG